MHDYPRRIGLFDLSRCIDAVGCPFGFSVRVHDESFSEFGRRFDNFSVEYDRLHVNIVQKVFTNVKPKKKPGEPGFSLFPLYFRYYYSKFVTFAFL